MKRLLLLLLLVAVPASAEFTDVEKASVLSLGEAMMTRAAAGARALSYLRDNPGAAPEISNYVNALWDIKQQEAEAFVFFADGESALAFTRQNAVAYAILRVADARNRIPPAEAYLKALEAKCGAGCANRNVLATRADFKLANQKLAAFDVILEYLDPYQELNKSIPGARRGRMGVNALHGDHYREFDRYRAYVGTMRTAMRGQLAAMVKNPALGSIESYWGSAYGKLEGNMVRTLLLWLAVEDPASKRQIDCLAGAFDPSGRIPRLLTRGVFAHRLLVNGDHDQDDLDLCGQMMERGAGYDLNQLCINVARHFSEENTTAKIQAWVDSVAASASMTPVQKAAFHSAATTRLAYQADLGVFVDNVCGSWFHLDDMANQDIDFIHFPAPPPPPIDCSQCEGDCLPCPDPASFCGPETSWDADLGKCTAPPPVTCPQFEAVLNVDAKGIIPVCVEVPRQ